MKKNKGEHIERVLAEAYRRRPVPEPGELWHERVMQAIRAEPVSVQVIRLGAEARTAWRVAGLATAAAVVMAWVGISTVPSGARLAWELQQDGPVSGWALQTGE